MSLSVQSGIAEIQNTLASLHEEERYKVEDFTDVVEKDQKITSLEASLSIANQTIRDLQRDLLQAKEKNPSEIFGLGYSLGKTQKELKSHLHDICDIQNSNCDKQREFLYFRKELQAKEIEILKLHQLLNDQERAYTMEREKRNDQITSLEEIVKDKEGAVEELVAMMVQCRNQAEQDTELLLLTKNENDKLYQENQDLRDELEHQKQLQNKVTEKTVNMRSDSTISDFLKEDDEIVKSEEYIHYKLVNLSF